MKRSTMLHRICILMTAVILCAALTGCGMNKEKALSQLKEALEQSSEMDSGRMSAEMELEVALGADVLPMNLKMEGAFRDRMQTMALKMSGEMMGQALDTQTYQLDGNTYTLDAQSGKYHKTPAPLDGTNYQKLVTLGQEEMVGLYLEAAKAAEDFAFTEEEQGLRVQFTAPQEQLTAIEGQIRTMMLDELMPQIEQQMRSSVEQQVDAMLESMGEVQIDADQLSALIDQQIQMVVQMERQLFESLHFTKLFCDMLIEDGVINDQSVQMNLEFNLGEMVETLAAAMGTQADSGIPETCGLNMKIHSLITERNQELSIEMPDFSNPELLAE
jgi:hypothetical protein